MKQELEFYEVDPYDLVPTWTEQTRRYWKYAERTAELEFDHDRCKAALEVREDELKEAAAALYLEILARPKSFGLESSTVDAIKACVLVQARYKEALQAIHDAKDKMNEAKNLWNLSKARVYTMDHRKTTLENVTKLRVANMYGEPKLPDERDVNGNRPVKGIGKAGKQPKKV
jgi:hypothetical protein